MLRVSLALVASLALPAVAAADVRIAVPPSLLGGRVAPANILPPGEDPVGPNDLDAGEIDLTDPDFWRLVWPSAAGAIATPDEVISCDEDAQPGSCGVLGDDAAGLTPVSGATTQESPAAGPLEATLAVARPLRPAIGSWMASQTPRLSWTPTPGATHYNVQIYLGPRRVASAWTKRPLLVVPSRAVDQGRYYMWSVWPAFGSPAKPTFGEQIGRSVFGVILRPRIVFRSTATGVQGEIRPRIPGGMIALRGPKDIAGRVPKRVRIGANSRINLRLSHRDAERLSARLLDPGPRPPSGLRPPR